MNHSAVSEYEPIMISVVIPTYKRAHILKNCLCSLVNQNLSKHLFEIIVVSDGADQKTEMIVESFKASHPFIYYFHLSQKNGPAAARNFGWQVASGKLIAFTDDDCLPDGEWLSSFCRVYNNNVRPERSFTGTVRVPRPAQPTDYEKNMSHLETAEFVTANCCCTRPALEKVGGFDDKFSMAWREDSDLEFKLLKQGIPIIRVDEAVVVHPVRKTSWGISIKEQKKGIFNALLYKKFPELYRKKIQLTPPWNYYMIATSFCLSLMSALLQFQSLAFVFALFWLSLTLHFIFDRLKHTARTLNHIMEMIITSLIIPFVSVYWQLYGSVKYRVMFF